MSSPYTKYQGYRPVAVIEAQMPYPPVQGGRQFLDTKFHAPNHIEAPPDASHTAFLSSVFTAGSSTVQPGDYRPPERKLGLQILPMEKEMWSDTVTHTEYPDYPALARTLLGVPDAALEAGFAALDPKGEGFILLAEMRPALRVALGGDEPVSFSITLLEGVAARHGLSRVWGGDWVPLIREAGRYMQGMLDSQTPVAMLAARTQRPKGDPTSATTVGQSGTTSRHGEASPPEEKKDDGDLASTAAYDAVASSSTRGEGGAGGARRLLTAAPMGSVDLSLRGLHVGQMRAALLTASSSMSGKGAGAHAPPSSVVGGGGGGFKLIGPDVTSAYTRDVGEYGSNPRERATADAGGQAGGHPQTTANLSAGTTRMSRHPPGYTGHVPADTSSHSVAAKQGLGGTLRNTFHAHNDLSQTFSRHINGYGGHKPDYVLTGGTTLVKARGAAAESDYDHGMGHIESWHESGRRAGE